MRRDDGRDQRAGGTTGSVLSMLPSWLKGDRPRHRDRRRARPTVLLLEGRQMLSTFTVNSTGDAGSGSGGSGDLRYCINQANGDNQSNTIVFDPTTFGTPQTITLGGSRLTLSDPFGLQTMQGSAAGVTISGGGKSTVLNIGSGVSASLSGLTITGGVNSNGDGSGGLYNSGSVTLTGCSIAGNSSGTSAGGLFNKGTATITDCSISGNTARYGMGGGIYNSGTAALTDCSIAGNTTNPYGGGGLFNKGTATVTECTVSGNTADYGYGGGLSNYGSLTLTDSTIASNVSQAAGGGLSDLGSSATITGCTFTGNNGSTGGAIFGRTSTRIEDAIMAGNSNTRSSNYGPQVYGTVTSLGHNLVSETDGSGGWTGTDLAGTTGSPINAKLGPLGDYGGPTFTVPLQVGSPAITAGVAVSGMTTDQRGFALDSPSPDIGAFQTQPAIVVNTTVGGTGSPSGDLGLRQAVDLANALGAAESITFSPSAFAQAQKIALTGGQLTLSDTAGLEKITGPSAGVTISAGGTSRVFAVNSGVSASLSGLAITGGSTSSNGGGIYNQGTLSVTNCTITGSSAEGSGGGIDNNGPSLIIANTTIQSNSAALGGGGLSSYAGSVSVSGGSFQGNVAGIGGGGVHNTAQMALKNVWIRGNASAGEGAGGDNYGTLTLIDCTIDTDTAAATGGALYDDGTLTLESCTVTGNSAAQTGGGIDAQGTVTVTSSTFTDNHAAIGGAIDDTAGYVVKVQDSILAGDSASSGGPEFNGPVTSLGHNLVARTDGSSGWVSSDLTGTSAAPLNALLGQRGSYGGPTQTVPLLPGSPAIGHGVAISGITTDQRGKPLDSPAPDIGAFQSQGFTLTVVAGDSPQTAATGTAFAKPLGVTVKAKNSVEPVAGGVVTYTAPSSGASAKLSAGTATIGGNGVASVNATANSTAGSYSVTASAAGAATPATFSLTNSKSTPPATATFLKTDTTTSGNWSGVYGANGTEITGYTAAPPSYAKVSYSTNAATVTWSSSTTDSRAPQNPANHSGSRIAAARYNDSGSSLSVTVDLTDGQAHDVELYFLDWLDAGRSEQVQIANAATGTVLTTEAVSSFNKGTYLDYKIGGDVTITITKEVGGNAVLTGLFFDPASSNVDAVTTPALVASPATEPAAAMTAATPSVSAAGLGSPKSVAVTPSASVVSTGAVSVPSGPAITALGAIPPELSSARPWSRWSRVSPGS